MNNFSLTLKTVTGVKDSCLGHWQQDTFRVCTSNIMSFLEKSLNIEGFLESP